MNETLQAAYELSSPCTSGGVLSDKLKAIFDAPWQAEAFAVTVSLVKSGQLDWKAWVNVFSEHIAAYPQQPDESVNDAYYRQWLSALESVVVALDLANPNEIEETQEHWRRSYLNTVHGQPVIFSRAHSAPGHGHHHHDHDHDHDHSHGHVHVLARPISVSLPA